MTKDSIFLHNYKAKKLDRKYLMADWRYIFYNIIFLIFSNNRYKYGKSCNKIKTYEYRWKTKTISLYPRSKFEFEQDLPSLYRPAR